MFERNGRLQSYVLYLKNGNLERITIVSSPQHVVPVAQLVALRMVVKVMKHMLAIDEYIVSPTDLDEIFAF